MGWIITVILVGPLEMFVELLALGTAAILVIWLVARTANFIKVGRRWEKVLIDQERQGQENTTDDT